MRYDAMSLRGYVELLGAGTAVPGGGSAAALSGALAAALAAMTAGLTISKEKYRNVWEEMRQLSSEAQEMARRCLDLVQADPESYEGVMAAYRLPRETDEEKMTRREAVRAAFRKAADVPLETLRMSERILKLAHAALKQGNLNCLTDAWAGVCLARTAASVAAANVRVNLPGLEDEETASRYREEVREIIDRIERRFETAEKDFEAAMH